MTKERVESPWTAHSFLCHPERSRGICSAPFGRPKDQGPYPTHLRSIPMAFTWQSAGHAFASLFKDVVTVSKKVVVALGGLQNEAHLIESLTRLVSPQAAA